MQVNKGNNQGRRNRFTPEEDVMLLQLVEKYSPQKNYIANFWTRIADEMKTKNTRQCKDRYSGYLKPNLITVPFTMEEDLLLVQEVRLFGTVWHRIRDRFPNRSDTQLKNRYNCLLRWTKGENMEKKIKERYQVKTNIMNESKKQYSLEQQAQSDPSSPEPVQNNYYSPDLLQNGPCSPDVKIYSPCSPDLEPIAHSSPEHVPNNPPSPQQEVSDDEIDLNEELDSEVEYFNQYFNEF